MCCSCCLGGGRRSPIAPRSTWPPPRAAGSPAALREGSRRVSGEDEGGEQRERARRQPEHWDTQGPPAAAAGGTGAQGGTPARSGLPRQHPSVPALLSPHHLQPPHTFFRFQWEVGLLFPEPSLLPHLRAALTSHPSSTPRHSASAPRVSAPRLLPLSSPTRLHSLSHSS